MGDEKSLGEAANAELRRLLRETIASVGGQEKCAEAMGVSQGYLSDVVHGKRGVGAKVLAGLASLRPELASRLLLLRAGKRPVSLPREIVVPDAVRTLARSILEKRGWSEGEIAAGARRARLTSQTDAEDPIAVADAWELPLVGATRKPERRPKPLSPAK